MTSSYDAQVTPSAIQICECHLEMPWMPNAPGKKDCKSQDIHFLGAFSVDGDF